MKKGKHLPVDLTQGAGDCYGLSLSDGTTWRLSGVKEYAQWVDELATIMELKQTGLNGAPRLVFYGSGPTGVRSPEALDAMLLETLATVSKDGWECVDYNTLRIWSHNENADIVCELKHDDVTDIKFLNMWMALQPIYERSIQRGGLPFHAALADLNGKGVLLVGSGDKGKTTCYNRLREPWLGLCDDELLVVLDKDGEYRVHPFPTWSDYLLKRSVKTWNVQYSVPLAGAFFIEKSEIDEVISLGEGQAAVLMTESATEICQKFWKGPDKRRHKKSKEELFNNACEVAKKTPAYRLRVSVEGRFWEKVEEALGWPTEDDSA
jgi:SynChlorMet cassette protein ScmC